MALAATTRNNVMDKPSHSMNRVMRVMVIKERKEHINPSSKEPIVPDTIFPQLTRCTVSRCSNHSRLVIPTW